MYQVDICRLRLDEIVTIKGETFVVRKREKTFPDRVILQSPACRLDYRPMSNKAVSSGGHDERGGPQEHRDRIAKGGMDDDERYQTNG